MIHQDTISKRELSLNEDEIKLVMEFVNKVEPSNSIKQRTKEERVQAILGEFKWG